MIEVNISENQKALIPELFIENKLLNYSNPISDVFGILFAEIGKDSDVDENLDYTISAELYAKLKHLTDISEAYKVLKDKIWGGVTVEGEETKGIDAVKIEIVGKDKGERITIIYKVSYTPGKVHLTVAPEFKAALVKLKKEKGKKIFVSIQYILPMQSIYSRKIYYMCKRFEGTGKRYVERYDWTLFRKKLGVPDSYSDGKIRDRILESAKKIINETSDILIDYKIEYKNEKTKRGFLGITFDICTNPANVKIEKLDEDEQNEEDLKVKIRKIITKDKLKDSEIAIIIDQAHSNEWFDENILKLIEYAKNQEPDSYIAYILGILSKTAESDFIESISKKKSEEKSSSFNSYKKRKYDVEELLKAAKVN